MAAWLADSVRCRALWRAVRQSLNYAIHGQRDSTFGSCGQLPTSEGITSLSWKNLEIILSNSMYKAFLPHPGYGES